MDLWLVWTLFGALHLFDKLCRYSYNLTIELRKGYVETFLTHSTRPLILEVSYIAWFSTSQGFLRMLPHCRKWEISALDLYFLTSLFLYQENSWVRWMNKILTYLTCFLALNIISKCDIDFDKHAHLSTFHKCQLKDI